MFFAVLSKLNLMCKFRCSPLYYKVSTQCTTLKHPSNHTSLGMLLIGTEKDVIKIYRNDLQHLHCGEIYAETGLSLKYQSRKDVLLTGNVPAGGMRTLSLDVTETFVLKGCEQQEEGQELSLCYSEHVPKKRLHTLDN